MEGVVALARQADGIIFGTPVYFGTISAQLKAFFDKLRYLRAQFALCNVVGGAMAVGHSQYGGEEQAMAAVRDAMLVYGMTIVGNTHPELGAGHGGVGLTDPAKDNEAAAKSMTALARRIFEVAKATQGLRKR
jgi:multimeric flavodoxin WrbA